MIERLREQLAGITGNVQRAKQLGAPIWPLNEADTERLVVEPILQVLGYGELDYRKRVQAVGANYPDYLVLPGSEQQWILEAKEWDTRLDERCERQAVNYASNNGAQWAVLTNGRVWWVYNTRVAGDLTQQRVYELNDLFDTDAAIHMLSYLSISSIQGGELDKAYRAREIRSAVAAELRSGNKQIMRAIGTVVGKSLDRHIAGEDIVEALDALLGSAPEPVAQTAVAPPEASPAAAIAKTDCIFSLHHLAEDASRCTGQTPVSVSVGDGPAQHTSTWRDVVTLSLRASGALDKVQLSYLAGPRAKRYFLNGEACHFDGRPMLAPHEVQHNGQSVYVELHYSAQSLIKILFRLLQSAGANPHTILIHLDGNAE